MKKLYNKLKWYLGKGRKIDQMYKKLDYLTAYQEHSNITAKKNYKIAVGGKWEEIGKLQYDFLLKHGLQKEYKLLDYGCGSLRGGRKFIKFLDKECYTGIDISEEMVKSAKKVIEEEGLKDKKPKIILNDDGDLKFDDLNKKKFDTILAQSVFTHLKPKHVEEVFKNLNKVMHDNSVFYFTAVLHDEFFIRSKKDFSYPTSYFHNLSKKYSFNITKFDNYNHPRNQVMFKLHK